METKKPDIKLIIDPCEECFHSKVCLMKKSITIILERWILLRTQLYIPVTGN